MYIHVIVNIHDVRLCPFAVVCVHVHAFPFMYNITSLLLSHWEGGRERGGGGEGESIKCPCLSHRDILEQAEALVNMIVSIACPLISCVTSIEGRA